MNTISIMSANYVARELGYRMTEGWMQGDGATNAWFAPLATFEERFDALLAEMAVFGTGAIDLWTAHLHHRWATPEHLAIARRLLGRHGLRVVSYAGNFGASLPEVRASCRLAAGLGIPVLGGGTALLQDDRPALVATLREFGLVFGLENHPEKTVEELWEKLGPGDEDVLGVAADTGWFGTQGLAAPEALRAIGPRLKHLHLKDVRAAGAHETCRLGAGVVAVDACVRLLAGIGYLGPVSIEHEPESFDPTADIKASVERVRTWLRPPPPRRPRRPVLRLAVVGCGHIAGQYAERLTDRDDIALVTAQDLDPHRAETFCQKHGGRPARTLDEALAHPEVNTVLNLTVASAHAAVTRAALEARHHVYSEKPAAATHREMRDVLRLARKVNRRLASAPSTWLGEAQQTAWKLVRDGRLGVPRAAHAECLSGRVEAWHANPAPFYTEGPLRDVGVYPLTLLTAWFGPVRRVTSAGAILLPGRHTLGGTVFTVATPDWQVACLEFAGGLQARVTCSFHAGSPGRHPHALEVHGDDGTLLLDSWARADTTVAWGPPGAPAAHPVPPLRPPPAGYDFAAGVRDLAEAIAERRPHRCGADHALHVLDVLDAAATALATGRAQPVRSTFAPPAPLPWAQ